MKLHTVFPLVFLFGCAGTGGAGMPLAVPGERSTGATAASASDADPAPAASRGTSGTTDGAAHTADPPSAPLPILDGRSYEVTLEIPDSSPVKDTLIFANGKFQSTACTSLGFPQWSDYTAQPDTGAVAFHALAKHSSGTTMDWNGKIEGDLVSGMANRTRNGKTDVIRFRGPRRQ
jgi:hypothetical protein